MSEVPNPAPLPPKAKAAIVLTMLALPLLYLAWAIPRETLAKVQYPVQTPEKLAQLEAQTRSNPTETNRLNLSQEYINRGMQGQAIGILNAMVAEYPNNALGWNNLCVAHTLQQEYNLAIAACQAGIRADGTVQLLRNNLKWATDEQSKTQAALAAEQSTPENARNTAFYLAMGMNQLHLGAYDEAIATWQKCLTLDSRNGPALNDIGVAKMMQQKPLEAEKSFRQALAIEPANSLYKNNLDWSLSEAAAAR